MYNLFWLETIKTSKVSIFLIILFSTQFMQMIKRFSLKKRINRRSCRNMCFVFKTDIYNVKSMTWPLKEVKMTVCSMQSVDLTRDAIRILGIYFSYNMNLKNQKNDYQAITNTHDILKLWRIRNSKLKLVCLALLTVIPDHIIEIIYICM